MKKTSNPNQIKIEKGIKIPDRVYNDRGSKYPLSEMGKGDSFLISCKPDEAEKVSRQLNSAFYNFQKRHGGQFSIRKVPEGVRIWRIK